MVRLGCIPVLGSAATVGKYVNKVDNLVDGSKVVKKPHKVVQLGSHSPIDAGDALQAGEKWLGKDYKEIAPGVFRSADGMRQFRMTDSDLDPLGHGVKEGIGAHVHFEALDVNGEFIENSHIPISP